MAGKYWGQSWNPLKVKGGGYHCTKCSPGCDGCWAEKYNLRNLRSTKGKVITNGIPYDDRSVEFVLDEKILPQPLRRKKPTVYFVCDLCDLFHEQVPDEYRDMIYAVAALCEQHTFLFLTKREKEILRYMNNRDWEVAYNRIANKNLCLAGEIVPPLPNVYNGLTICNQAEADEKLPVFLQIPGHKWLSIEPCLGDIDLRGKDKNRMGKRGYLPNYLKPFYCRDCGEHLSRPASNVTQTCGNCGSNNYRREKSIEQVLVGGESGVKARPMHPDRPRSIRDQCKAAGVPFFFKQWGEFVAPKDTAYHGSHKGWRFPVSCSYMKYDGTYYPGYPSGGLSGWTKIYRIGTKRAGRLLDGVEHNNLIWPSQAPRKRRRLGRP